MQILHIIATKDYFTLLLRKRGLRSLLITLQTKTGNVRIVPDERVIKTRGGRIDYVQIACVRALRVMTEF